MKAMVTLAEAAGITVAQVAMWCGNSAEVIWKHYAGVSQEYAVPVL